MKVYYFLFGKAVCDVYNETASIEATKKELDNGGGVLYNHPKNLPPTVLLCEFVGWDDFVEIDKKTYDKLCS